MLVTRKTLNIVEDATPQLGGDLDVNSHAIVSADNGDIEITTDGTGSLNVSAAGVTITGKSTGNLVMSLVANAARSSVFKIDHGAEKVGTLRFQVNGVVCCDIASSPLATETLVITPYIDNVATAWVTTFDYTTGDWTFGGAITVAGLTTTDTLTVVGAAGTGVLTCERINCLGTGSFGGDIHTTGAGDDLWLGAVAVGDSNLQLYANGNLVAKGISVFGDGTTNYTQIAATGHLTMVGTATVWDDVRIVPGSFQFPGGADPTLQNWQPGGSGTIFPVYKFKKDDYVTATCQIPHNYKEGSDVYFHIHWTPCDRGNEETTALVGWKVDYSWANADGTFGASATVNLSDACQSTDHHHLWTPDVLVSGTGKTMSSIVMLKIYRSDPAPGTDDTWAGTTDAQSPAILEFDIHYEINSIGSQTTTSKA